MARIRTIKPEFPQSESMGRVSRDARLCFIMLWTIADDAGRLRGNSRMLASLLYPYDDDAKKLMDKWLAELEGEGCITRYAVNCDSYVQVNGWSAHQKIDRPSASKIPPPIEGSTILAISREPSSLDQGRDQGPKDQGNSAEVEASPPAFTIPLVDKTEYPITRAQVDEWKAAYPAVDVAQQLREMRTWCLANPAKRKTARGVSAFIVRWLGSEQDKGGKPQQGFASNIGVTTPINPAALYKPEPALTPEQLATNRANAAAQLAKLKQGGLNAIREGAH